MISAQAKKEKILDNLRASGEPLTLGRLARVCNYPKSTVAYHIRRLTERGEVVRYNGGVLLNEPLLLVETEGVSVDEFAKQQLANIERYAKARGVTLETVWRLAHEFFRVLEPGLYRYFYETFGDPEQPKDEPPESE